MSEYGEDENDKLIWVSMGENKKKGRWVSMVKIRRKEDEWVWGRWEERKMSEYNEDKKEGRWVSMVKIRRKEDEWVWWRWEWQTNMIPNNLETKLNYNCS